MKNQTTIKSTAMFFVLLFSVITISGCGKQNQNNQNIEKTPVSGPTANISIKNFAFNPAELTIKKGTTVIWTNEDSAPHTATSQGFFDSGTLKNGQSFNFQFNNAGSFDYICTIHPSMKGKIIVE